MARRCHNIIDASIGVSLSPVASEPLGKAHGVRVRNNPLNRTELWQPQSRPVRAHYNSF